VTAAVLMGMLTVHSCRAVSIALTILALRRAEPATERNNAAC
jgi:hypothetical protein